jgi:maleamate amidohydrolase
MLEGSTEDLFKGRRFGERVGFGEKPAVLVVDFQQGLTQPGWPLYGDHDEAIEATRRLLDVAREQGTTILFTAVGYSAAEVGLHCYTILDKMPAMAELIDGSPGIDVDPRLGRRESEPVLVKRGQSAFLGTPLGMILTGLRIDTLLVCGANTSGCVRGTVMDASALSFHVALVEECLGDVTRQVHDASIFDMDAKNGDLVSLAATIDYLRSA